MGDKKTAGDGYKPMEKGYKPTQKPTSKPGGSDSGKFGYQPPKNQAGSGQGKPPKKP